MTARPIIQGESEELRRTCTRIIQFDESIAALVQDLVDTMKMHHVLGLSAPQIGESVQALVVDVGGRIVELVNPEITFASGEQRSVEHCASLPDTAFEILRPDHLTVVGQDRNGLPVRVEASGLLARLLQHELDHLHGILFHDSLSEEELFLQLMMTENTGFESGDIPEEGVLDRVCSCDESPDAATKQQVIDMMADASWKFTLAMELLQELTDVLSQCKVAELLHLAEQLRIATDEVEVEFLSIPPTDEPSDSTP